jgi:uncharacterized protein
MTRLDQASIEALTRTQGEGWGYAHVCRVMALAGLIAGDLDYHPDWFWYAAHLHDWGAFSCYRQPGVDHALRSRQIAESEVLPRCDLPLDAVPVILEAIERHDYRDPRPASSPEALLLREADFLDFLGPVGVARELAWGSNDIGRALQRVRDRIEGVRGRFTLPQARRLAEARIAEMEALLRRLQEDSFGYLS